ncbi:hypothetical protein X975_17547, partial [Stegodyphus mimosarum]
MVVKMRTKTYTDFSRIFLMRPILLIFISLPQNLECARCQNFNYIQNDAAVPGEKPEYDAKIMFGNYSCPGTTDPKHHTECCSTLGMRGCCPKARYFYEIDRTVAAVIAISVTSLSIVITIVVAICCFWSRCPLYSACRTEFSPDIATYVSKEDNIDMDTMPRELSGKGSNKFSPINISNGNLPVGVEVDTK